MCVFTALQDGWKDRTIKTVFINELLDVDYKLNEISKLQ